MPTRSLTTITTLTICLLTAAIIGCSTTATSNPQTETPSRTAQEATENPEATPRHSSTKASTTTETPDRTPTPTETTTITITPQSAQTDPEATPVPATTTPQQPGRAAAAGSQSSGPPSIEDILQNGLQNAGASPVHLAVRATPQQDSTRCQWRGIARTLNQRADTVRMMLDLAPTDEIPHPDYLEILFDVTVDTIQPDVPTILKSNFNVIAKGGLSEEYLFLTCFTEYDVAEYLLGTGPTQITIAQDQVDEMSSYYLYAKAHDAGDYGEATAITQTQYEANMLTALTQAQTALQPAPNTGQKVILLAPMGAHHAIAFEAWQIVAQWPVSENDDATLFITRPELPPYEADHQVQMVDLKSRITAATTGTAETLVPNVSGLTQYYRDIGAYGDITPDDGSTDTFMPAMPPSMPACAGSTAVGTNPDQGLINDCDTLLAAKDTLAGTATLNWYKDLAMASWNGIRLGGTPARVQYLLLTDEDLDGSIPAILGNLTELRRIDLDENDLSGHIPPQLGNLKRLTHLYLQTNQLNGEIPPELGAMTALQVLYPEDNNLTGHIPEEIGNLSNLTQLVLANNQLSGPLPDSLGNLQNLGHLRLRDNSFTGQIPKALSGLNIQYLGLSGNSFTGCLPTGLDTGGNDDLWREELASLPTCGPVFGEDVYTFNVARTAAADTTAGTVTVAPYEADGQVTYKITSGNDAGLFDISTSNGNISLTRTPLQKDNAAHTLTVEAQDSHGQTTTIQMTVALTN